jgi:hypothetical protein
MPTEAEDLAATQAEPEQKQRVIIPPPEIKSVVEKTASYVAKNGVAFEAMIMGMEKNNPKFNFLKYLDDPYRPYYLQIREQAGVSQQDKDKTAHNIANPEQNNIVGA